MNHDLSAAVEQALPSVVIEPDGPAAASVIWLHGLGADGHDFEPVVAELGLETKAVRFVFPHAPRRPVTINNGCVMRAWYDITSPDFSRGQDEEGLRRAEGQLRALINRELARGIPSEHLVLAGFSQGGAVALHTGLRYPRPLAGILALSTYLPLDWTLAKEASPANAETAILMAHGEQDPLIPLSHALASRDRLQSLGYRVEWHQYPMEHGICPEEINIIGHWLREVL